MDMVNIKINGMPLGAEGFYDFGGCQVCGHQHPTLCFLKDINEIGACRMCVVEVKGAVLWLLPAFIRSTRGWKFSPIHRRCRNPVSSRWMLLFRAQPQVPFLQAQRNCELQSSAKSWAWTTPTV